MTKVSDRDRDGHVKNKEVAVQLSGHNSDQRTRIAIALPEDAPPSNYIPMEPHVLAAKLSRHFEGAEDLGCIESLNKRIGLRCALRTEDSFSNADRLYSIFDPDSDPVTVDENCEFRTLKNLQTLKADLDTLLDMAGFQPVPQDHITISKKAGHLRGFRVQHPPSDTLRVQMFYQRLSPVIVQRPHWLLPWKTVPVQVMQYGCLVACFQQIPAPAQPPWTTRLLRCLRLSVPLPGRDDTVPLDGSARPGTFNTGNPEAPQPPLHLRVFRSVALHDADMLVPGAVARFTALDQLLIWVPILIGVGSAIYKIATSSLTFNPKADPVAFATTLALVLMPLSYAVQARFSLQQKADNYKADIDELLLMRQRSSNSGALQWLLDSASEQEQKEMLLAYAFLWGGRAAPLPVARDDAKHDIDAAIERFLSDDLLRAAGGHEQAAAVDFDMADALGDVVREGLVREGGGSATLQALPMREAVEVMSIRNYPEQPAGEPAAAVARYCSAAGACDPGSGGETGPGGAISLGGSAGEAGEFEEEEASVGPVRKGALPPLRHKKDCQ